MSDREDAPNTRRVQPALGTFYNGEIVAINIPGGGDRTARRSGKLRAGENGIIYPNVSPRQLTFIKKFRDAFRDAERTRRRFN